MALPTNNSNGALRSRCLPDTAIIDSGPYMGDSSLPRGDNITLVSDLPSLQQMADFFREDAAELCGVVMDKPEVDAHVQHETQHGRAAPAAGFQTVYYGLWVMEHEEYLDFQFAHYPRDPIRPITKLAMASIVAAPEVLSPSDRSQLAAMGYAGADDVAERILAHNEIAEFKLHIPLSYKGAVGT